MKLTSRHWLALLLTIAFAIRLTAGWAWQSRLAERFGMGDSESYWALGLTIAEGTPYEYGADRAQVFRTPGYPILLAPILWLMGDGPAAVLLARAEAALLGVGAVAAVWWITRLLFDDRAALVAAGLATFYPGAIVLSVLILSEAPFCPLMLLDLGLWIAAWQANTRRRSILLSLAAGLAAAAATLMRPSWLPFTPLAAAVGMLVGVRRNCHPERSEGSGVNSEEILRCGSDDKRHLGIACWMLLGLVAGMLPWWVRNACVTGHFVPTTLQVGASLYDGLSPDATGGSNMDFVPRFVAQQRERYEVSGLGRQLHCRPGGDSTTVAPTGDASRDSFERDLDRRLWTEAIAWAKENPGRVLQLAGVKFLRMWNVWPNERRISAWPIRLAVLFTYTPLLFFAIIGAWRTLGRGWPYILCWLPAVYFTLLHTVFVSSIRYREPAMLALLALAAGAGIKGWKKRD